MTKLTALEALNQSIHLWTCLEETGLCKEDTIEFFPELEYIKEYQSLCACCEFAYQQEPSLDYYDCKYCPAGHEVHFCDRESSFHLWWLATAEENEDDARVFAKEIRMALEKAKARLELE